MKRKEKNEMESMKLKPKWVRDYNYQTGGLTGAMPYCPRCEEPLYETDKCVFCGQEIDQDDEQLKEWLEPPEVKTMECMFCGGIIEYTESKYNGHKHGRCRDCQIVIRE